MRFAILCFMRGARAIGLMIATFVFLLNLPLLHFHPNAHHSHGDLAAHHHEALVHSHMPSNAVSHTHPANDPS